MVQCPILEFENCTLVITQSSSDLLMGLILQTKKKRGDFAGQYWVHWSVMFLEHGCCVLLRKLLNMPTILVLSLQTHLTPSFQKLAFFLSFFIFPLFAFFLLALWAALFSNSPEAILFLSQGGCSCFTKGFNYFSFIALNPRMLCR